MNDEHANLRKLESIVITPQDIIQTINRLDSSKACGPDMVPAKLLKMSAIYIAEPLAKIFNKSLSTGKYPTPWKRANVKPIFKGKGSPSEVKNYRPISLLPCVSKNLRETRFQTDLRTYHCKPPSNR